MQWLFQHWVDIIIPVICVLLTHYLSVHHERQKQKSIDNTALQEENKTLKEKIAYYEDVEQSPSGDYYVLKAKNLPICQICWGNKQKAIPVHDNGTGHYICGVCKTPGVFNRQTIARLEAAQQHENERTQDFLKF